MCGIGGVVVAPGERFDGAWIDDMVKALAHRGPDDAGRLVWQPGDAPVVTRDPVVGRDGRVGFAHTRLSILDLSPAGWQPMSTSDGRFHLAFNGEIYNYVELRAELAARGHAFHSGTDTEVLLAAYAEWGTACLTRLVGMFAFAVLDVRACEVVLARDFFGIKPLLYARWAGGLAFASEVNPLLLLPSVPRRPHPSALFDYLQFGLTGHRDQTVFETIRQIPAAHFARISVDRPDVVEPVQYWAPTREKIDVPFVEAVDNVRELFVDNVRLHLRSDVPVGTALSGGIDSSAIVTVMRELAGARADINSFSYLADEPRLDEERWVDLAAAAVHARVHKVRVSAQDLVDDLDRLIVTQGEPFGSTSIYAQDRVFRLAGEASVPVMLDGQGADELFAGYRSYLASRFASLVRRGRLVSAARLVAGVARMPDTHLDLHTVRRVAWYVVPESAKPALRRLAGRGDVRSPGVGAEWFAGHGIDVTLRNPPSTDLADALHAAFLRTSLPTLLRYEDRNSMAYSIESRVPFLTPRFVDYVFSLPDGYLVGDDGLSKKVFREAMRGFVPDAILDRRDKIGFATPELTWLESVGGWVDETLTGERAHAVPALHARDVRDHWENVRAGHEPFDWRIWRWLNTIRWAELYDMEFGA